MSATAVLPDIASQFPVLSRRIGGKPITYLDSAATSQTPQPVIDAMTSYYTESRASIHRGVYPLAVEATDLYEGARDRIADWLQQMPDGPVTLDETPAEVRDALRSDATLPEAGADGSVVLDEATQLLFKHSLFNGHPPSPKGAKPEQKVNLPEPMPLYITYLTAVPSGTSIVYFDDFYGKGYIRQDGSFIHAMYLMQVKTPAESKEPWDYYKITATIPGEQAFTTKQETRCALWK